MQAQNVRPDAQGLPAGPLRTGRCVLLSPSPPPEGGQAAHRAVKDQGQSPAALSPLIDALTRRGVAVIVVSDPPRAMLELIRSGAMALIVADPGAQPQAGQLIDAVRTVRPHTVCWQYGQRAGRCTLEPINGRLGHVTLNAPALAPVETTDSTRATTSAPSESSVPDSVSPAKVTEATTTHDPEEPLVSADELAMLLGPIPES